MPQLADRTLKIIGDGNSMTSGYPYTNAESYLPHLQLQLKNQGYDSTITNIGVTGQTTLQMLADGSTQVTPLYDKNKTNILIVNEGGNGISLSNDSAQYAYDLLVSYCVNRRSEGFYVIVWDCFTRSTVPSWGTNAQYEARLVAYNQLIRDNWRSFCDCYVDIRRALPMIVSGNEYMPDGVHPSATGYALMGVVLAREVSLLRRKST